MSRLVDSHAHFWDVARFNYPWIEPGSVFDRTFSLADYQQASHAVPIEKMVFVECDAHPSLGRAEAQWVEQLATLDPRICGLVARVQLTDNDALQADLQAVAERPLVKGIRHNIQHNPPGFALRDEFVHGIKLAHRHGLHFELCLTHDQLSEVIQLVQRCPEVSFVLDHCAKPAIRAGLKAPWEAEIRALARLPNVVCKISGLLTEADWSHWTLEEILWYAQTAADAFGGKRILFGSDWPVNEAAGGYARWYSVTESLSRRWSAAEKDDFYFSNAERVYRL